MYLQSILEKRMGDYLFIAHGNMFNGKDFIVYVYVDSAVGKSC